MTTKPASYTVATLSELEIPALPGSGRWAMVRHRLGISSFGINAWTVEEAGQEVISEHDELGPRSGGHEELYVVLDGRATFTVAGEEIEAGRGTFVFVRDPAAKRKAVAGEAGTTVLAIGARPGEAFTPAAWERSAPAFGYFATREYDKAREILAAAHEEHPDDAGVLYNLACAESQLGRTDDAIRHLRESIEGDETFRELAQTDTDFDSVREDSRYRELVGAG